MLLKCLNIFRFLGFKDKGLMYPESSLGPGLNIILGPNGSGKSVTLKALKGLLWPMFLKGTDSVSLSSRWLCGKKEVVISLEGQHYEISEEKLIGHFPPISKAGSYFLSVDDLFDATDDNYALKLFNEAFGGYDLVSLKDRLEIRKLFGQKESLRLLKLEQEKKKNTQELAGYFTKKEKLKELEYDLMEAKEAKEKLLRLEDFHLLRARYEDLNNIETKWASWPKQLEYFRGNEGEILKKLESEREEIENNIRSLEKNIKEEEEKLNNVMIFELSEANKDTYQKKLVNLLRARQDFTLRRNEYEKKKLLLEEELRYLHLNIEDLRKVDLSAINSICAMAQQLQDLLFLNKELLARNDCLEEEVLESVNVLKRDLFLLEEYKDFTKQKLLCFLLSALGLVSFFFKEYITGSLLLVFLIGYFFLRNPKRKLQKKYGLTHFNKKELDDLEIKLDLAIGKHLRKNEEVVLKKEIKKRLLTIDNEIARLSGKLCEACKSCGINKMVDVFALKNFVENLQKAREFLFSYMEEEQLVKELDAYIKDEEREIALFFRRYDLEVRFDEMEFWFNKLLLNADIRSKTLSVLNGYEKELCFYNSRLEEINKANEALILRCQVLNNDALKECLRYLDEYRKLFEEKKQITSNIEFLQQKLGDIALWEELDKEKLSLEVKAKSYDKLLEEYTTKKTEVYLVEKTSFIDDVKQRRDLALKDLEAKFKEACVLKAGLWLLGDAESSFKNEAQCKIFDLADEMFGRFTKGRYKLSSPRKVQGKMEFFTVDNMTGEMKSLLELSRGTRMQLIMAIRLAFMKDDKLQLPLFFDEAMSSADDERMKAMFDVLFELVKEGRQIFYFTCKQADVDLLRQKSEEIKFHDINFVKLDGSLLPF